MIRENMYKFKKPVSVKINGAFRKFRPGQTIAEGLVKEKMIQSLLADGFIEPFANEKAVFHNEGQIKRADTFKQEVPEEYKELKNLKDLEILDKPKIKEKIPVVEEESRKEVLSVPDKREKVVSATSDKKKEKLGELVMTETYEEVAKIAEVSNKGKRSELNVENIPVETDEKVEGQLDTEISEAILEGSVESAIPKTVNKRKPGKKRGKSRKKVE